MAATEATTADKGAEHSEIKTDGAPAAIGPYSQAVKANGFIYVSGCIGLVPGDASKALGETVTEQADQSLKNMAAVLEAAGSSMHKVVKTTVLLRDMAAFGEVNKVYAAAFEGAAILPARAAYAVAGLPLDALVEIEAVALA
jgi:2-iminobutanoate/2-iminopropanoate deaminase